MTERGKCAAVWVATDGYAEDAARSAASVKAQMPGLACILASDAGEQRWGFDYQLRMPPRIHEAWYHDSCRWYNAALAELGGQYERLVFLDTDTYCAWAFWDLLDVLDRYDLLAGHGAARHTAQTVRPIPDAFPELCIGLMAVRTNERTARLFDEWLGLYDRYAGVYGNNDQGPLREALWNNQDVRLYVVPAEYHCRWPFGAQVTGKVRVLHSRNGDQAAMAEIFNATGGMRCVCTNGVVFRSG